MAAGVRTRAAASERVIQHFVTSELLPEPLTPVTVTNAPSGNATSRFLRLCWRAPRTVQNLARRVLVDVERRFVSSLRAHAAIRRTGIAFLPDRYCR